MDTPRLGERNREYLGSTLNALTCYQNVIRLHLLTLKEINKAKQLKTRTRYLNELTSKSGMKKLATFFKIIIYFWKGGGGDKQNSPAFFLSKTDFQ